VKKLFGLALTLSMTSLASAQTTVPTTDRSRVLIEYTGPTQLSNQFMVMRIRIGNRSGRDRAWAFEFKALKASYGDVGRRSRFELEVEDGQDRQFEILVPLSEAANASWVQMAVFGHGVANAGQMELVGNTVSSRVAVSSQANMRSPELRDLLTIDPSRNDSNVKLEFQAEALTDDWRAYSSLSVLWLGADEWKEAEAALRRTLLEWVAGGGRLVVVESGDTAATAPFQRHGLGMIVTVPEGLADDQLGVFQLARPPANNGVDSVSWVGNLIEPIETHKGFLSLVLLGYLVLAAPVNLLVFSPGTKRMRLFWTMPAIALGASAVMAAVILLQDGVGGSGYRRNLVYLLPELNRELIVQEQVSRTGALLRRSFEIEEPAVITDLTVNHLDRSSREFGSHGARYAGDWFRSRSIQAQRLQWARSSRARVELVGTEGTHPVLLSSIDVRLDELYFRDESGQLWHARNVLPGRSAALRSATEQEYERFLREVSFSTAGPGIRTRVDEIRGLRGAFLASAGSDVAIETLTSIDWNDAPVLYAGHIQEASR
jgi:hypothetical protein